MDTITITCRCPLCGKFSYVTCDVDQLTAYDNGALAQDAFPTMDLRTRETLISGMCADCQESFFETDDDDYEGPCDGECDICINVDCPSYVG